MALVCWWFAIIIIIQNIIQNKCETKICIASSTCICANNELCILQCVGKDICKDTNLGCKPGHPCNIECNSDGGENVCENAQIDGSQATDVTITCHGTQSCINTKIYCGTGTCNVQCTNSGSKTCYGLSLHCASSYCSIQCEDGANTCDNINVDVLATTKSFECIHPGISNAECSTIHQIIPPFVMQTKSPTLPTIYPTTSPSYNPSTSPSDQPTLPTLNPTDPTPSYSPTYPTTSTPSAKIIYHVVGTYVAPEPVDENKNDNQSQLPFESMIYDNWIYLCIAGGVAFCCLVLVCMRCCKKRGCKKHGGRSLKKKKNRPRRERSNAHSVNDTGHGKFILPVPEGPPPKHLPTHSPPALPPRRMEIKTDNTDDDSFDDTDDITKDKLLTNQDTDTDNDDDDECLDDNYNDDALPQKLMTPTRDIINAKNNNDNSNNLVIMKS